MCHRFSQRTPAALAEAKSTKNRGVRATADEWMEEGDKSENVLWLLNAQYGSVQLFFWRRQEPQKLLILLARGNVRLFFCPTSMVHQVLISMTPPPPSCLQRNFWFRFLPPCLKLGRLRLVIYEGGGAGVPMGGEEGLDLRMHRLFW